MLEDNVVLPDNNPITSENSSSAATTNKNSNSGGKNTTEISTVLKWDPSLLKYIVGFAPNSSANSQNQHNELMIADKYLKCGRIICRICASVISAHKYSFLRHTMSASHIANQNSGISKSLQHLYHTTPLFNENNEFCVVNDNYIPDGGMEDHNNHEIANQAIYHPQYSSMSLHSQTVTQGINMENYNMHNTEYLSMHGPANEPAPLPVNRRMSEPGTISNQDHGLEINDNGSSNTDDNPHLSNVHSSVTSVTNGVRDPNAVYYGAMGLSSSTNGNTRTSGAAIMTHQISHPNITSQIPMHMHTQDQSANMRTHSESNDDDITNMHGHKRMRFSDDHAESATTPIINSPGNNSNPVHNEIDSQMGNNEYIYTPIQPPTNHIQSVINMIYQKQDQLEQKINITHSILSNVINELQLLRNEIRNQSRENKGEKADEE